MVTETDWQRAQEEERYRRTFLDGFDLENARPYIKTILYTPRDDPHLNLSHVPGMHETVALMETIPNFLARRFNLIGWRSRVKVYPEAFLPSYHANLDDFLSGLIDHEGYHAKEHYEIPDLLATSFTKHVFKERNTDRLFDFFRDVREQALKEIDCEIRTYNFQLAQMSKRNVSDKYRAGVETTLAQLMKLAVLYTNGTDEQVVFYAQDRIKITRTPFSL